MGKLISKKEFEEKFLQTLSNRDLHEDQKVGRYEPVVRSGITREETVELVQEICSIGELYVNPGNLAIELKSIPYHTAGDVYDIVHKFEINKARIRTNTVCFCITLLCCFLGFYFLTKVSLVLCILVSSVGSGLITFVWDNKENPGAIPSSDM